MQPPEQIVLSRGPVRLEPFGPEHDEPLLAAAQDDDIWRWLPARPPRTLADMTAIRENHPGQPWAVVLDGVPVGSTSYLEVDTQLGALEIGWTWYRKDVWATPLNPTCKLLLMSYAFDDLGAGRVAIKTDRLNTRSQAAIKKLGCQYDGTLRHHRLRPDGSVRDTAYFSMLPDEWPPAKERLESRAYPPGQ
jgi:RimJ/RimL family protein N-acetyltransferase